jgi:hypothetical protein
MSKRLFPYLINLAILTVFVRQAMACSWGESPEVTRLAAFRAEYPDMAPFRPFYFSASLLNSMLPDPEHRDWMKNCDEWRKETGEHVPVNDIHVILYKTDPNLFLVSLDKKDLARLFDGNRFIAFLLEPGHRPYLDYVAMAKKIEFLNNAGDPWNVEAKNGELRQMILLELENRIKQCTNAFIKRRYGFQVVRLYFQTMEHERCIAAFDSLFDSSRTRSIVTSWALLHKAQALDFTDRHVEANILYAKVFAASDEKKIRVYQLFNIGRECLDSTMALIQDRGEKAAIMAIRAFKNPGPALSQIRELYRYNGSSEYLAPLIMREVNKLEDWVLAPQLPQVSESSLYYKELPWEDNERKQCIVKNLVKDKAYMAEVCAFLKETYPQASGNFKSFCAIALAHLLFMSDRTDEASRFLARLPKTLPQGLSLQKAVDETLVLMHTANLDDAGVQDRFASLLAAIDKTAQKDNGVQKLKFSLLKMLSAAYHGNKAFAGLLYMKAEIAKEDLYLSGDVPGDDYGLIAWFDRHASYADIENLLRLIDKKNKTLFEKYLCDQTLASTNAYLNLAGTVAFRENNLDAALRAFERIPDSYWNESEIYSYYLTDLNRSYLPLFCEPDSPRDNRSKTVFVRWLRDRIREAESNASKKPEIYFSIANAYYNCSYWGKAWIMMNYFHSEDLTHANPWDCETLFGAMLPTMTEGCKNFQNNYYCCAVAERYYKKALTCSADKEQRARVLFMLCKCDLNGFLFRESLKPYDAPDGTFNPKYADEFCDRYQSTETFRKFDVCVGINCYINDR